MKIKSYLLASFTVLAISALVGCDANTKQISSDFIWPAALSDCKAYRMSDGNKVLYVVRCPKADVSTTYQSGKNSHTTVVTSEE